MESVSDTGNNVESDLAVFQNSTRNGFISLAWREASRNKIWKLSLITCIMALEDCKASCLWTLSGSLSVHRHKFAAGITFANPCYGCQRHPHSSTTIPWKDLIVIAPGDFSTNTLRPLSFTGTQHGSPAPWSSPDECSIVLITACPVGWTWAEKISGSHFKVIR